MTTNPDPDLYITYKAGKPWAGCFLGKVFRFSYTKTKMGGCYTGEIDDMAQIVHDAGTTIAIFHPCSDVPSLFTSPKRLGTVAAYPKLSRAQAGV
jgi:hypothetical protein